MAGNQDSTARWGQSVSTFPKNLTTEEFFVVVLFVVGWGEYIPGLLFYGKILWDAFEYIYKFIHSFIKVDSSDTFCICKTSPH